MTEQLFAVEIPDEAVAFLKTLPAKVIVKVSHSIDLLVSTPFIGRIYDPEFETATPPEGCRRLMVSSTTIEIFYVVDEEACCVDVVYIDDARMDPKNRFENAATPK